MASEVDLQTVYIETLLKGKEMPLRDSDSFRHVLAQCIAPVHERVEPYLIRHAVANLTEEAAGDMVDELLSGHSGHVLPSVQPYRTGKLFWTNRRRHDELDLAVTEGAIRLGKALNGLRADNPLSVSTNATSALLNRNDFASKILRLLEGLDFDPNHLVVEILEDNDFTVNAQEQFSQLKILVQEGVRLSMDDLGRKKSLQNLKIMSEQTIPVAEVKFDGEDTAQMKDRSHWSHIDELLHYSQKAGATTVVWEGYWKGVESSMLEAVREYHLESSVGQQWDSPLFEGTIV
ncbi:MAG: hypothetical protein UW70_C0062G0004 [Candidatus Peregrinibacteria bacterium GW2011_GWA2_44_7]|nr:MAG: hypothetical protein UW70_C0062G0004 [Candidatus Peregrinibacteria bacterium GW2011_GWA2_44_7]